MKKIKLSLLAMSVLLNMSLGVFLSDVYADDFSLEPNGELYELQAGQTQSFAVQADLNGIAQALSSLEAQTTCQEKVCVCTYHIEATTWQVNTDTTVTQAGAFTSTDYDCRELTGGVVSPSIAYSVSIAEPGENYYLNIRQVVNTEGASFGADGAVRVLGGVEVHQVKVNGKEQASETPEELEKPDLKEPESMESSNVEMGEETPSDENEPMKAEEGASDDAQAAEEPIDSSDHEYELLTSEPALEEVAEALNQETSKTFTVKIGDGVVLMPMLLGLVKDSGKNLVIRSYQGDQVQYEWTLKNAAIDATREFNPTVTFDDRSAAEIETALVQLEMTGAQDKMYFSTAQAGALMTGTRLKILLDENLVGVGGQLNLYNYDQDLGEIEVAYEAVKLKDGYAEFTLQRGSVGYFLTPAQIVTVDLEDEVETMEEEKKTNWLFFGIIGGGAGLAGIAVVAGFWWWRKKRAGGEMSENNDSAEIAEEMSAEESARQEGFARMAPARRESFAQVVPARIMPLGGRSTQSSVGSMDMVRPTHAPSRTIMVAGAAHDTAAQTPRRLVIS